MYVEPSDANLILGAGHFNDNGRRVEAGRSEEKRTKTFAQGRRSPRKASAASN